jgi:hypothetical protein
MNYNAYGQGGVPTPGLGHVVLTAPQVSIPNGWVYSTSVVDKAGHAPSSGYLFRVCPVLRHLANQQFSASTAPFQSCLTKLGSIFHTSVSYQPASRFWPLQWAETGIFLGRASPVRADRLVATTQIRVSRGAP